MAREDVCRGTAFFSSPLQKDMAGEGHVYTIELEKGNYYVGHSKDLPTRIAQHFLGEGSNWTKLYKPLRVLSVTPGSRDLETATFAALCVQKGWAPVRTRKANARLESA